MEIIYSECINKIKQNKTKLEKSLKVKLSFSKQDVLIDGEAINEYIAAKVIEAITLGFTIDKSLLLCNEDFILEKINIKDLTKRRNLGVIRSRIIGTKGKTKEIIQNLSGCFISLHDNAVGIIGSTEDIKKAMQALASLVQGAKQSRVYSYLERKRSKEKIKVSDDLGLK